MPHNQLNRFQIKMQPLAARPHKFAIDSRAVLPDRPPGPLSAATREAIARLATRVRFARQQGRPVVCAMGAHTIKNGLGPVLIHLIQQGWLTHLATNGAGVIHDWEFSYLGQSCEDVQSMVAQGLFGNWEETGFYVNLALNVGAYQGRGYGESVGGMICEEGLAIPSEDELLAVVTERLSDDPRAVAAAADLLWVVRQFQLAPGWMAIAHPWKQYSIQGEAFRLGVPLTGHPMIGHDIIYNHPMNQCQCVGRCAGRDFLTFADSISRLEHGVYISVGSAIMSPMIFEKSLSLAQNLALQRGQHIDHHLIVVVDLAQSTWDWSQGEPPEEDPAYYLRYNKTFSRMGGTMCYLQADNRDFLLELVQHLAPI